MHVLFRSTLGMLWLALAVPCVWSAGMEQFGRGKSLRHGQTLQSNADQVQSWNLCQSCEWGVRSVQDFVANPDHQDEMAQLLDTVTCKFLPHAAVPKCENQIRAGIRHFVEVFEDTVSPSTAQLPEVAGLSDDVDKALLNVCTSLPEPFQEPCRGFMSEYGQEVAEVVHTSPGTSACTASGLCAISGIDAMTEDDIPAELHDALADGFSKIGAMHLQQTCRATDDLAGLEDQECEFCKIAVQEVRQKIADPVFQAAVEKYLEKMCERTGDFQETCKQYIMQYGPIAFALAEQYLVPSKVCVFVRFCPLPGPPPMSV